MASTKEFPPLLGSGFHELTIDELRALCVGGFPFSTTRPSLMRNLETIIERLKRDGVEGDLWIDGSFVTQKIDPMDIDLVFRGDSQFYEQSPLPTKTAIEWIIDGLKAEYGCDSYGFLDWPDGHPDQKLGEWFRRRYIKLFGLSTRHDVKGIALIKLKAAP